MRYVALLRGINVGGSRKVAMADLREMFESLGFGRVETYVQSGNVVFDGALSDPVATAATIEAACEQALGFSTDVIVVSGEELAQIVASNPFVKGDQDPGADLYVTFLREPQRNPVDKTDLQRALGATTDEFVLAERHVYLRCPGGYGRTKLSNPFFEKRLGAAATTRNWRTVTRLSTMAGGAAP